MKPNIFLVLINKEMLEQWRSGRLIIILAVFLFFGIASPLGAKFMPEILESAMKDQNITIQIPEATWMDSAAQFAKNISQMGVFILILLSMGTVAKEKENGIASFLLVKPVSRTKFILSKFASQYIVLTGAMVLGFSMLICYTQVFFGSFPMIVVAKITMILFLYLIVIQSVTIFFSILIKTQITAGILSFVTTLLFGLMSLLGKAGIYSPSYLNKESQLILKETAIDWQPFAGAILVIVCCIIAGIRIFRKWEN